MLKNLNIFTALGNSHDTATGWGKVVMGVMNGMETLGVQVRVLEREGASVQNSPHSRPLPIAIERGEIQQVHRLPSVDDALAPITLVLGSPLGWGDEDWARETQVYLLTMSESDKVSAGWVTQINQKCAGVLVTCPELVEIYRRSGVRVPVWNVGMGVKMRIELSSLPHLPALNTARGGGVPNLKTLPMYSEGSHGIDRSRWLNPTYCDLTQRFIFLTYSYGDMRKGAHLAIQAFKMLFGNRPNLGPELWIKARDTSDTWLAGCMDRRIKIIEGDMPEDEWADLLAQADCFVFPSYGEGFGLPPREATLMGTPAIATGWLGLSDVHEWGIPLRVRRLVPAYFEDWGANGEGARWAEPDVVKLAQHMRWVMANPARARQIAARGREYLLRYFSWARTAEHICRVIPH